MKKIAVPVGMMALVTVIGAEQALAESLEIREIKGRWEASLAREVARANDACRSDFKATIDWTGAQEHDIKKNYISGACGNLFGSIESLCSKPDGKEAVRSQIRNIVCGFGADNAISLSNGVIRLRSNFESSFQFFKQVNAYLADNLRADSAGDDSLTVRRKKVDLEQSAAERVALTNRLCKSNLAFKIDWSGLPADAAAEYLDSRNARNCTGVLVAVRSTCESPAGEKAVRQQIRSITCRFAPASAVSLKDGVLTYTMNLKSSDSMEVVQPYLDNNLRVDDADRDSLKLRRIKARQEESVSKYVTEVNRYCESSMAVKFDWSGVPAELSPDDFAYKPESHCSRVLSAIRSVCNNSEAGRNAVRKQITSVTCGFGAKRSIALKDGTLNFRINFKSTDDGQFVSDYLQSNL